MLLRAQIAAIVVAATLGIGPSAALADLSETSIASLGAAPEPGSRLPLDLKFADDAGRERTIGEIFAGRAAVLIFADYACTTLCGPVLSLVAAGLENTGLVAGQDYGLVVIGLDHNDNPIAASQFKDAQGFDSTPLRDGSAFLAGDEAAIIRATEALGYRFTYDRKNDQFAHPAAVYVLTAEGVITRVLSGLDVGPGDLRLALVEAGEGRIGSLRDRVSLMCYGFDPARGTYSLAIRRILMVSAATSALVLAAAIGILLHAEKRQA